MNLLASFFRDGSFANLGQLLRGSALTVLMLEFQGGATDSSELKYYA